MQFDNYSEIEAFKVSNRLLKTICFAALAAFVCSSGDAYASTGISGYNQFHFPSTIDGTGIFKNPGATSLKKGDFDFGFVSTFANRPIKLNNPATGVPIQLVDVAFINEVKASVGATDWLSFGMNIPVVYSRGDDNLTQPYSSFGVGDIIFQPKVRFVGEKKRFPAMAVIGNVWLPTGARQNFTGNEGITGETKLVAEKNFGKTLLTANAGYRFVNKMTVQNSVVNDLFTYGGGISSGLTKRTAVFAELIGGQMIGADDRGFNLLEADAGIKIKRDDNLGFLCGIGGSLKSGQAGSGTFRAFAGVSYAFQTAKNSKHGGELAETAKPEAISAKFGFDEASMGEEYLDDLEKYAAWLKDNKAAKIMLAGHADSTGLADYNKGLSKKRAENVAKILTDLGVDKNQIIVQYFGESMPMAPNLTKEGRSLNRRVDMYLTF